MFCSGSKTSNKAKAGSYIRKSCDIYQFHQKRKGFMLSALRGLHDASGRSANVGAAMSTISDSSRTPPKKPSHICDLNFRRLTASEGFTNSGAQPNIKSVSLVSPVFIGRRNKFNDAYNFQGHQ